MLTTLLTDWMAWLQVQRDCCVIFCLYIFSAGQSFYYLTSLTLAAASVGFLVFIGRQPRYLWGMLVVRFGVCLCGNGRNCSALRSFTYFAFCSAVLLFHFIFDNRIHFL